jgi:membrane-associated protease RseP (regulator of RpoE activity)
MKRIDLVVVAGLLAFGSALAASAPFEVSTGRPMVQLTVQGNGPFPFVLDTGAPGLIVRPDLVDQLGLEVVGTTEVNSPLGGTPVEVRTVRVETIDLAGASVSGIEAIVLAHLGKAGLGMGVVGPAVFREHGPMQLDFATHTLNIGDDAKPADVATWIPFGASAPLLDVPVQIGDLRLDGHIDTGSPDVLAVPTRFEEQLPLSGPARTVGRARTVDAEFEIRAAPIDASARVADAEIPLREIKLAELPVANLGTGGLNGLKLYIDWEHERFALTGTADPVARKASPRVAAMGERPRFGVRAQPSADGAIEVVGTDPGSPAEKIGLLAGDRIVAINGKSPAELGPAQVRSELVDPDVELTVERGGETLRLKRQGGDAG